MRAYACAGGENGKSASSMSGSSGRGGQLRTAQPEFQKTSFPGLGRRRIRRRIGDERMCRDSVSPYPRSFWPCEAERRMASFTLFLRDGWKRDPANSRVCTGGNACASVETDTLPIASPGYRCASWTERARNKLRRPCFPGRITAVRGSAPMRCAWRIAGRIPRRLFRQTRLAGMPCG